MFEGSEPVVAILRAIRELIKHEEIVGKDQNRASKPYRSTYEFGPRFSGELRLLKVIDYHKSARRLQLLIASGLDRCILFSKCLHKDLQKVLVSDLVKCLARDKNRHTSYALPKVDIEALRQRCLSRITLPCENYIPL